MGAIGAVLRYTMGGISPSVRMRIGDDSLRLRRVRDSRPFNSLVVLAPHLALGWECPLPVSKSLVQILFWSSIIT